MHGSRVQTDRRQELLAELSLLHELFSGGLAGFLSTCSDQAISVVFRHLWEDDPQRCCTVTLDVDDSNKWTGVFYLPYTVYWEIFVLKIFHVIIFCVK